MGKIEDVEKALVAKTQRIANKQISPKSQIQRISRKERDFWDADRP